MNTSAKNELIQLSDYTVAAILNTASGTCTPESEGEMIGIFSEFGLDTGNIWAGHSDELPGIFEKFEKSGANVLVVLGGDGTIRSAAARSSSEDFMLVPLPGGTMNVLPHALYGLDPWQKVLRSVLKNPSTKKVSGGEVNGERFFISAICGSPALFAEAREAIRDADVGKALEHGKKALDNLFSLKIKYKFDDMHEGETEALTVTCPLIVPTLNDDRKVFEAAVIDLQGVGDIFQLATTATFGAWRDANNVAIVQTPHVDVSADGSLPIILDGELIHVGNAASFDFIPDAITILVPADEVLS